MISCKSRGREGGQERDACVITCFSVLLAREERGESQAGFIQSPLHTDPGTFPVTPLSWALWPRGLAHPRPSTGSGWASLRAHLSCWILEGGATSMGRKTTLSQVAAVLGSAEWSLGDGQCSPWWRMVSLDANSAPVQGFFLTRPLVLAPGTIPPCHIFTIFSSF